MLPIKLAPCCSTSRRPMETPAGSTFSMDAVASKKGFLLACALASSVSSKFLPRSPIIDIDDGVKPVIMGMRFRGRMVCPGSHSIASILVSSSSIARTGTPPPYLSTKRSKLFRLPNAGRTAGSPSLVRNAESSNHPERTFLVGCCTLFEKEGTEVFFIKRVTSDLGNPVIIDTRDLLVCPESSAILSLALATAIFLSIWVNSRTVTLESNIKFNSGSMSCDRALSVASRNGSESFDGTPFLFIITDLVSLYLCQKIYTKVHLIFKTTEDGQGLWC